MRKNLLAVLLLIQVIAMAQQSNESYKFSKDIAVGIEKDTVAWKYQTGAVNYSFIGDYRNTLTVWDKNTPLRVYVPTKTDSAIVKSHVAKNAADYIVSRSVNEQVIIINEAHHIAMHRTFTKSLLERLYKNGYRYLGLEAIYDMAVNQRNYAVKETGYYTAEPEFGNLIYEAKKLGFVIFSYEASEGKNGKEREIEQAKNIAEFMKTNTKGKYLIHCGFSHVYENEVSGWEKAMAGRLREYTGINPFTIDQVKFSEKSKPELGHYFVYALKQKEPFVLINDNVVFNGISEPKQTDIVVIHPITEYKHDRPLWLAAGKKEYRLPEKNSKGYNYPVQVLAYRVNEYENGGTPADIIELADGQDSKPLFLQKGSYKIIIRDNTYNVVKSFPVSVK